MDVWKSIRVLKMRGDMMNRVIMLSVLLFIFIGSAISPAQQQLAQPSYILDVPQGFVLESLSSYGYNNTTINTISNISNTNPANMFDYNRISFGISYQVDSKIKDSWYADIDHYRKNQALPQSFSFILPLNKIRIGLGFSQKYNSELDYGEFTGTIVDTSNPAGYLDIVTVRAFKTCHLFDYSLSLGYTFNNFVSDKNSLDIGLKISWYRYSDEFVAKVINILPGYQKDDFSMKNKHSTDEFSFAIGMKYRLENLQIGLVYERGKDFNKKAEKYYQMGRLPDKWSAGILLKLSNQMNIAGGLNYVVLDNPINDYSDGVKNQIEPYGSIICQLSDKVAFSTGFFHTDYRYRRSSDDRFNAWYVTAGFLYTLKFVSIDLAIADSHLFSDEWRKQTIFKIGLDYQMK